MLNDNKKPIFTQIKDIDGDSIHVATDVEGRKVISITENGVTAAVILNEAMVIFLKSALDR